MRNYCLILNISHFDNYDDALQVRIQDLCKGGGCSAEILPTSRSGVASVAKIWASKWGVGGGGPPGPLPRSAPSLCLWENIT